MTVTWSDPKALWRTPNGHLAQPYSPAIGLLTTIRLGDVVQETQRQHP